MTEKSKRSSEYAEKLKDPRWQKRRLEIMGRDEFTCQKCFDSQSTLMVHHRYYIWTREPWDYPDDLLVTLCGDCHNEEHAHQAPASDLVKVLQCNGFFNDAIADLVAAFHCAKLQHSPEVFASALVRMMGKPERIKAFMDNFFSEIKAENEAKKNG